EGVPHVAGFTDDLQVGLALQQVGHAATNDLVIVHEEHPGHVAAPPPDSIGTLHRTDVAPGRDLTDSSPPRSAARSARLARPLRRPSSGMPRPSSSTSTRTISSSTATPSRTCAAERCLTLLVSSSDRKRVV